ncbi:MAG: Tungstate-binding protein TupA [Alphaproteobacteria bacterium MarineAlpha5_Bin9]|nr:MAG: Tungstate-binding protein TupA [Alphaproteobacteria bacterium MarineAlpha5_Bin9]|tara:strand:- start:7496 stop:8296 length:801 start_codon:yes stop_codon:yes gene_type:complete
MKKILILLSISILFSNIVLARNYLILQSTTSTDNSGLLQILKNEFEKEYNIELRVVAVGTGQAIKNAKNGDADLLLIHSPKQEISFVAEGYGLKRIQFMYNDYVIIGPENDPLGIKSIKNINDVMKKIYKGKNFFLSRDDNSGTHLKEKQLWKKAGVNIDKENSWYLKNGQGMGSTLNMAYEMQAYTLTDRGTWLSFNNKKNLSILFEDDPELINPYSLIIVNPEIFPHVQYDNANLFINWILSNKGMDVINKFNINGEQLFFNLK